VNKQTMMQAIRGGFIAILLENDFRDCLYELVWEHLFNDGNVNGKEDEMFNKCFSELVEKVKVCLKVST